MSQMMTPVQRPFKNAQMLFVNSEATGKETGTATRPFRTLQSALYAAAAVLAEGSISPRSVGILIAPGDYTGEDCEITLPAAYDCSLDITAIAGRNTVRLGSMQIITSANGQRCNFYNLDFQGGPDMPARYCTANPTNRTRLN